VIDASQRTFLGISALLFAGSAAVTVAWCGSMSAMGGMVMPGDWTMSMAWMRMPGQSWSGAAATFLGMWVVMMIAMMLPSLVPMLLRYRRAMCCAGAARLARLTTLAGLGYFFVWTAFGVVVFPLGVALAAMTMQLPELSRAVPMVTGAVVVVAGALQFSAWKARHLACCRGASGDRSGASRSAIAVEARGATVPDIAIKAGVSTWPAVALAAGVATRPDFATGSGVATAWRHGVRLGIHCVHCCAGLTAMLLVIGVMDLRAMAVVAAAITLERLAPAGQRVARVIGAIVLAAGVWLMVRAAQ
jgi:predicted metal-binding membrane protein